MIKLKIAKPMTEAKYRIVSRYVRALPIAVELGDPEFFCRFYIQKRRSFLWLKWWSTLDVYQHSYRSLEEAENEVVKRLTMADSRVVKEYY
jgi:hypothetical protein